MPALEKSSVTQHLNQGDKEWNNDPRGLIAALGCAHGRGRAASGAAWPAVGLQGSHLAGLRTIWVEHLRSGIHGHGGDVEDITAIKARQRRAARQGRATRALVGDYVIEGHVPAEDVRRLLKQRARHAGIGVPGMPIRFSRDGGGRHETAALDVLAFDKSARITISPRQKIAWSPSKSSAPRACSSPRHTARDINGHASADILFLSGQVAHEPDGSVAHRGDFKQQARGAFRAIEALVKSQGGTMANVVKITTYVTDMRYRPDLVPIREEFLGKKGPASTLVEIPALAHPDWMIEIEAIAVV